MNTAAQELRTAASIRRDIAAINIKSSYRKGMVDAHRDCIRTARYVRVFRQLRQVGLSALPA
jgi:hypothetical protein